MDFNQNLFHDIDTAIDIHLAARGHQFDMFGLPIYPPRLCYTLNTDEIAYGERQLNRTGKRICVVKRKNRYNDNDPIIFVCYYRHTLGKFIVALNDDGRIMSIC